MCLLFKSCIRIKREHSKTVPLLQFFFVCASVVSYVAFVFLCLFLMSPSFGASGRLCFVNVASQ